MPSGWKWTKLADVCYAIRGVTFKQYDVRRIPEKGTIPILRAGNILGRLNTSEDLLWVSQDLVSEEQKLQISDIVICLSSGSPKVVGKTAKLNESWLGSVGAFCAILRTQTPETGAYLAHWFQSQQFLSWRDSQARGANIQNLRTSELLHVQVPLPPLAEQKRIVSILNEQLAAVERARKAAEERLEAARALREAFLWQVFWESADGITSSYTRAKLEDVCAIVTGSTPKKSSPKFYGGAVPWVNPSHLGLSKYVGESDEYLTDEGVQYARLVPRGSVMVTCISGSRNNIGKAAIAKRELTTNQQINSVVPGPDVESEFLYYHLLAIKPELEALAASTNQNIVNKSKLSNVRIHVPPLETQRKIAVKLSHQFEVASSAESAARHCLESFSKLSSNLLRRAFSGEI